MSIKYHAQFLLDKEKDSPTAKLRYRIKWGSNILAFSLGYRIEVTKWSKETQRCKINTTHGAKKIPASVINKKIQQYEEACERVFNKFYHENNIPEIAQFRCQFNSEIGKDDKGKIELSFFEIFDKFTQEEEKVSQWTKATIQKWATIRNHLYNFNDQLNFSFFDEKGLIEYQFHLQENLKFKNSTIIKHFSFIRWFLKWSERKEYHKNDYYKFFKPKLKTTQKKIIFLTQVELQKFRNFVIPQDKKHLEKIRDVFLFQCFTGLRYSDAASLKKSDVKENTIEITTQKTADNLIIELNNYSKAILDKYKNIQLEDNKALPVISNQKMNEYLQELAELSEIDEPITQTYYEGNKRVDQVSPKYALLGTHAGRRTFICNALSLGIPPQVVMKWTGHSDYKAMKPYIDIADEIKVNAMEKFNLL